MMTWRRFVLTAIFLMRGRSDMHSPTWLAGPWLAVFVPVALALAAALPSKSALAGSLCRPVGVGGAPIDLLGRPCRTDRPERHLTFLVPVEPHAGSEFTTGSIGPFTTSGAGAFTTDPFARAPREPPAGSPVSAHRLGQRY